ncbi:MAG: aspartate aminotransferase family protein [Hyphomicrobiales bacterium]
MPAYATHILQRSLRHAYPEAVRGEGSYIIDSTGKRYLDGSGGAAVSCIGHGNPDVMAALDAQMKSLDFAHTAFFTTKPAEDLAALLSDKAPGSGWRVFFVSGGSEANEAALKFARQLQVERGRLSRDHFIARDFSYHGNTLGALSVSGNKRRRELYGPILMQNVRHIAPVYAYRHRPPEQSLRDYGLACANELEAAITTLGEDRVIAFIAETVSGATLGAVEATPGYFRRIREICDRHGVLMILDEVMSGMGRCGTLFACVHEGVVPDIITIGKGLAGGYQPVSAMLVREELAREIEAGSGAIDHGHTFVGHPVGCATGLAVQRIIAEQGLVGRASTIGTTLKKELTQRLGQHPAVGDIRGRGAFIAVELVADRETKRPFPRTAKLYETLKQTGLDLGLIFYPMPGCADGVNGDHVLLAPPYTISDGELDELVDKTCRTIDRVVKPLTV